MILTVPIKLLTDDLVSRDLLETLEICNKACNRTSQLAWRDKVFNRFKYHTLYYKQIREEFPIASQTVSMISAKVADSYKINKTRQHIFRKHGSISYDKKVLSVYVEKSLVSIWTVNGRRKISFVCGEKQRELLAFPIGQSSLIYRGKKWFIILTVDIPDSEEYKAMDWLGCDLGIVNILTDSDGANYSGGHLNGLRHRHARLRRKLQKIGTKSAKRLLAKRRRKESRFARIINHTISKRIVAKAKSTSSGIAIEELSGIRRRINVHKSQRRQQHSWAFYDLKTKIMYKAQREGVPVRLVDPRNTSRKCPECSHTEKANRRTRDVFACKACGFSAPADHIGSVNIRMAAINQPNVGTKCHNSVRKVPTSRNASNCDNLSP